MTLPALFFGLLVASACGLLFHLIRGGSVIRMLQYVITAWLAFFLGHAVSLWLDWNLWRVGPLNLFPALLAVFFGLIAASVLLGPEQEAEKNRSRLKWPFRRKK
jgi:hypothetical protein